MNGGKKSVKHMDKPGLVNGVETLKLVHKGKVGAYGEKAKRETNTTCSKVDLKKTPHPR